MKDNVIDITIHLTQELDELSESFKQLEERQTAAVQALRPRLPMCTDDELKQIVNIVLEVYC